MKTLEDRLDNRLDATCRIPDAERRRLIAAVKGHDGEGSKDDPQRGQAVGRWCEGVADIAKHDDEIPAEASATLKWSRSCVRPLREKDFIPCSNCRPALVGWIAFMTSVMRMLMPRRRPDMGNSVGIIVEQPILDLVGIAPETELDLTTDGTSLVITPHVLPEARRRRTAKVEARTLKTDAGTFRKLGW